jgi:hypothetical protein
LKQAFGLSTIPVDNIVENPGEIHKKSFVNGGLFPWPRFYADNYIR